MKLNQLRNILAIAEQGSLRAAARDLGLAQPALSRSVQELEHELGVVLFERRPRGMLLTPVGIAFVNRARNVMTELKRAREEAEQLKGGTGGTVTAALSIVPLVAIAPKILRPFQKRYPDVELQIVEAQYSAVENRLKDGSVDFYIGPPPEHKLPPELLSEMLFDNTRAIVCRKGHPLEGATSLDELADADWMTTSITYRAETELRELFSRHDLPMPRLALRGQSALTLMISLAHSDCFALVPVQWVTFTAGTLSVVDVGELPVSPPILAIRRSGLPLTPAAEYLFDLARRYGADSAAETSA